MNLSEKDLLAYNHAGLIPGPNESEPDFMERANYCFNLKNQISEVLPNDLPFSLSEVQTTDENLQRGCERSQYFYDVFPSWVPLFFSNYKLPFWHGGCAWIFQQKQDSPTSAFFQLRQNFRKSKKYLGMYDRDELIAHELSHVGRMKYEEPKYEEILAYRSSKSLFRRFFGPIIQSSYESTIFLLVLMFVVITDFFSIYHEFENWIYLSFIGFLLVVGMVSYGLIRLCIRQTRFKNCLDKLKKVFFNRQQAEAVIYRLTDKEIFSFSRMSTDEIIHYAKEQKNQNFRWKVIFEAYFNHIKSSDHYDGKKFHNNPLSNHTFNDTLKWMLTRKPARWPKEVVYPKSTPPRFAENELLITFVNHSTLLIQWDGINILTDPIWSQRAGPLQGLGPKRVCEPGINFEDLPPIDLVLISHNHYDHMDLSTLRQIQNQFHPLFITGLGNRDYLERKKLENVIELDWWQKITPKAHIDITFVPSKHFSMRNVWNRNKTLWGGFVLKKEDELLYFAGDTAYGAHFKEIRNHFGSPKIAFLPIGAFEPRWFMEIVHMSPDEAIQAHQDLGSPKSIAIHFGTFRLADEDFDAPARLLNIGLKKNKISEEEFLILKPGESVQE